MGQLINKIINAFSDMEARILIMGLDNAGRTTILYQMKLKEVVSSTPTVGFNVESIKYKGLKLTIWDWGGACKIKEFEHHYDQGSNAIIYVLDSSDK